MLTVSIRREECIGCQVCWNDCPDVFEESPEDGLSRIVKSFRVNENEATGLVPASFQGCIQEAAQGCPVEIIGFAPFD